MKPSFHVPDATRLAISKTRVPGPTRVLIRRFNVARVLRRASGVREGTRRSSGRGSSAIILPFCSSVTGSDGLFVNLRHIGAGVAVVLPAF